MKSGQSVRVRVRVGRLRGMLLRAAFLAVLGPLGWGMAHAEGVQDVLAPPAALQVQGVPQVPQSLVRQVARYNRFDSMGLVGWHPTERELLISRRPVNGNVSQLWRLASAQASPELLTPGDEPINAASYEPQEGRYAVVQRAVHDKPRWVDRIG